MDSASFQIHSAEGAWANNQDMGGHNPGHRPRVKGGYFPVPPVDSLHGVRTAMCNAMQAMGLKIEVHHHEVANAGQCEIGVAFNTLVNKADEVQILKYCIHNTAHAHGKVRMDLTTAHTNTTAQKLYESLGWTLDTVFRAYNKRISA